MSGTLVIRAATEVDAAAIAALCTRAARVAYADLVTADYLDRVIAHFYGTDRIRREIAPTPVWFGFVVALDDDDVVVGVAGTGQSAEHAETCELFTLYVAPAAHRRGIGRQLVAQAVATVAASCARRLEVAVIPGNRPAIHFYEACGFTFAGERPIYAPHGQQGGPPVALVYERALVRNSRSPGPCNLELL
jgi:ribosomal protein S18 acetylase RimI-like enzyme